MIFAPGGLQRPGRDADRSGHGRICNEWDVAEYRHMITIMRDRVQAMAEQGMTLAQVNGAAPAKDYDPLYSTAEWTRDMFVEAVDTDLSKGQETRS